MSILCLIMPLKGHRANEPLSLLYCFFLPIHPSCSSSPSAESGRPGLQASQQALITGSFNAAAISSPLMSSEGGASPHPWSSESEPQRCVCVCVCTAFQHLLPIVFVTWGKMYTLLKKATRDNQQLHTGVTV